MTKKAETTPEAEEVVQTPEHKFSDDLIAVVRELVQLSILTGTNVVDHLRAITTRVDPKSQKLVPTEEYVEAYNSMIEELARQAEQAHQKMVQRHVAQEDLGTIALSLVDESEESPEEVHFGEGNSTDLDKNDVN
jgi:hypothetical protein